jgi:diguanylate cyclase (GGDEF)-like protein/PAS domain S-box-containing protein
MSTAPYQPAPLAPDAAKILVVDDHAANRKVMLTLLRHEGYSAIEASDGAEGLRAAIEHRPRLVISDILMPTMDGYEFVRQLRTHADLASTAVIFYTANYHSREAYRLAEQCGVARVIVKPCSARSFLAAVSETLARTAALAQTQLGVEFDRQHRQVLTDALSSKADQLSALNSRFAALTELNVQLASEREPTRLLERVCAAARDLLGAKYAVLALASDRDGTVFDSWVSGTDVVSSTHSPAFAVATGLPAEAQKNGRALRAYAKEGVLDLGLPAAFPPATAALVAPIVSPSRSYGWLCLADKLGAGEFDGDDEQMLNILGMQVGRIYEHGMLYRELQEYATQLLIEIEERERAAVELRNSEERFRQLADNIDDVLLISNADLSTASYVSPAFERIWGRSLAEYFAKPDVWIDWVHPHDRERVGTSHEQAARNWPTHSAVDYRIVRPDGGVRWISERLFPIVDAAGKVVRSVGIAADITARKQAELRILQLSRVHAMLSGINSLIVRVTDRDELFREACRLAVEEGHFRAASCALLDGSRRLQSVATCGQHPEGAQLLTFQGPAAANDASAAQQALRMQRPVIYNDLQREGAALEDRTALLSQGIRGLAVLPLVIGGSSVGCLFLMTPEAGLFDAEETALLVELAGDISFALDHLAKSERLNHLAYYDLLSGLANRSLFTERLAIHADTALRSCGRFALVVVGPERMEGYNDALGRAAGEELLRQVAGRFAQTVGDASLVGRLGHEEFAALIPSLSSDYAVEAIIERWWKDWPGPAFQIEGNECTISAKAGIALFPADGSDADTLLRNAHAALKKAKSAASTHVFYTPNLTERLSERLKLESHIRRAVDNEEFTLHYQPKVDMAQRRVTGVEALMRWDSPQLGRVPPSQFIPVLEETGLIVEAGAWALRQACADRSRWLERRLRAPRIAVNVSPMQLRDNNFVRTVTRTLKLAGGEAGIDIEVTESLLMENVEENITKLAQIRELGVQIALDDFGTGYSSLSYLAKLPVETLKIDRSFVTAMLDDPSATALVSTIISLARALRLQTVAEGVESEEQAKILRLLQCDQMQGFLISRPVSCDDMTVYLSRARS